MNDWVGTTIDGRYAVVARLGRGGMAAVYRAEDLRLNRRAVALKHPLRDTDRAPGGLSDDDLRQRFQHEIAKLIDLGEIDGVVPIRDQGEHEGVPYFVMPLMEGGSLEDALARGPQGPAEVAAWARRVAEALDALHTRVPPVLHRDVKPANLLFDAKGRVHLADFGIVKELQAAWATTSQNTGIGTPGYMPPEQLLPTREIDARSDQYALAATMYRALTGQIPQYVTTSGAAHQRGTAPTASPAKARKQLKPANAADLAPHLPAVAAQALARALAEDQDARFATCAELVASFAAGLAGTVEAPRQARPARTQVAAAPAPGPTTPARAATEAPPPRPTPVRPARPPSARRWLVLGLLAVAVLVLAGLMLRAHLWDAESREFDAEARELDRRKDAERQARAGSEAAEPAPSPAPAPAPADPSPPAKVGELPPAPAAAPDITIDAPAEGASIPPALPGERAWRLTIRGRVRGLRTGQRVFVYSNLENASAMLRGSPVGTAVGVGDDGTFDVSPLAILPTSTTWTVAVYEGDERVASKDVTVRLAGSEEPSLGALPAWAKPSPEQVAEAARLKVPVAYEEATTGIRFVLIPGGTFLMGSPESEAGRESDEGPQHRVTLPAFYLSVHEVTNGQYRRKETGHVFLAGREAWPATGVDWDQAAAYAAWLSGHGPPNGYTLPTEAQWEYACRAGTTTPWAHGADEAGLGDHAWFDGNSGAAAQQVGTRSPNRWGLHDVHGNVWEWCADDHHATYEGAPSDGSVWMDSPRAAQRVVRGGSWEEPPHVLRSGNRIRFAPVVALGGLGFRLARAVTAR